MVKLWQIIKILNRVAHRPMLVDGSEGRRPVVKDLTTGLRLSSGAVS